MIQDYPGARVDDVQDVLAGVSFPDPYRWLERGSRESGEVRAWQEAQARLARDHVREWPHFERLRRLVARFSTEPAVALPHYAGGRWFRTQIAQGMSQAQVLVSDQPLGPGRVVFDPRTEDLERLPFLSWIAPSPDGRTLALGVCADGSENNTIRLVDVITGRTLADPPPQVLMDGLTGGVQWLPDSSGFFFSALDGAATDFKQKVYWHRRLPVPSTSAVNIEWTTATDYRMVVVSRDGRHAIAVERYLDPIPIAIAALGGGTLHWRPFLTSIIGTVAGHIVGDRYVAVTDVGATRGRCVAIALDCADPNDPDCWQELVPESAAVLRTVTPVGEVLYLTEFVDTYARVRIVDRDGRALGKVPLPGRGAIGEPSLVMATMIPKGHPDRFLFAFSSLTVSSGIYAHAPSQGSIEMLRAPQARLEHTLVEDHWAVSADGTRVPYHIVRRANANDREPRPTLIYAYGGYNKVLAPSFPGPMAAFVAAGGIFVHAHLRGGGELGREWWQQGRMDRKQNCYDDLYAIAEDLIGAGLCTSQSLAVTGRSNGGLMAGVAATQRPELWAVVVPRVPLLDLIGSCREGYGRQAVTEELSGIDDADEVRRLAGFSPYHLVRDGVRYPAIFIDAGDSDPRCPPWHARKFAARLQRASAGGGPILLHVWDDVGHGGATDREVAMAEHTEWLAFTLRHLGVGDLPDVADSGGEAEPGKPAG